MEELHTKNPSTLIDQCPPPGGPPSYVVGQLELLPHPEDTRGHGFYCTGLLKSACSLKSIHGFLSH